MTDLLATLEGLRTRAEQARAADAAEALADVATLRGLLPLAPAGQNRTRAADLLRHLTARPVLRALQATSLEELLGEQNLPLSASTVRRLLAEQRRRPSRRELATLARLAAKIRTALRQADTNAWEIGKAFDRIATQRLHRLTEHRTLSAWANATYPTHGYRTLARYRRIARAFTKPTAARFGVHKLDLGLRYLDLTPAQDRPAELARLEIPVPDKGRIPFAKITVDDLERAVDALTTEVSTPKETRLPRGASATLGRARRAFAAARIAADQPRPSISARVVRVGKQTVALFSAVNLPREFVDRMVLADGGKA